MAIPALLAKKTGGPVMMRISREEEHFIGRARPGLLGRVKTGFRKDGRLTAVTSSSSQDAGPYEDQSDLEAAPSMLLARVSAGGDALPRDLGAHQHAATHLQRSPGGMQANAIMEPMLAKAAQSLGIDPVEMHRVNAPSGKAQFGGADAKGQRSHVTSAFVREALDKGAVSFDWDERKARSGQRRGTKVSGVGISVSPFSGGYSIGYDGLLTIRPDGKLYVQSGIGNLGTHSVIDTRGSPPKCSACRGKASKSSGATPRSTCRGRARRMAARPCRR